MSGLQISCCCSKKERVSNKASCHVVPLLKEWKEADMIPLLLFEVFWDETDNSFLLVLVWCVDYRSSANRLLS